MRTPLTDQKLKTSVACLLRVERKCTADGDFAAGSKFTLPVRSADKRSLAIKFSRFYLLANSLVQSHSKLYLSFIPTTPAFILKQ
jgi:hypothetical protein